jgi:hypothetical protein
VTEIARHGLEATEKVDAIPIHPLLKLINLLVVGDGRVAEAFVPIDDAGKGIAEIALAETGHHEQVVLQREESLVE